MNRIWGCFLFDTVNGQFFTVMRQRSVGIARVCATLCWIWNVILLSPGNNSYNKQQKWPSKDRRCRNGLKSPRLLGSALRGRDGETKTRSDYPIKMTRRSNKNRRFICEPAGAADWWQRCLMNMLETGERSKSCHCGGISRYGEQLKLVVFSPS